MYAMASLRYLGKLAEGRICCLNGNKCGNEVMAWTHAWTNTVQMWRAAAACALPGTSSFSPRPHGSRGRGLAAVPRGHWENGKPPTLLHFAAARERNNEYFCGTRSFVTSACMMRKAWEARNKRVYPPQKPDEPPRMAEVHFSRRQIKHSMRKLWYIATFIKGMTIGEALTQLQFINRKSAKIVRGVLFEAQEEAVKKHNVEFKSNLHIAQSFVGRATPEHAMRIHAKGRFSILDLSYCNYFVCLKEGPPPKIVEATGYDQAKHYIESLRKRTVIHSI